MLLSESGTEVATCHNVSLFSDYRGVGHVYSHTWKSGTCSEEKPAYMSCDGTTCVMEEEAPPTTTLKLLSYNIWNFSPPWAERLQLLISEVEEQLYSLINI